MQTGGNAGTIDVTGNYYIAAQAYGGNSGTGVGGSATGSHAWLDSFGATVSVGGYVWANALAQGGSGAVGGSATGGAAYLVSSDSLTVGGAVYLDAFAEGGTGFAGNGGNANPLAQSTLSAALCCFCPARIPTRQALHRTGGRCRCSPRIRLPSAYRPRANRY